MVDQTWIPNVKHTKGVKLLKRLCSADEPQKPLLLPKLNLYHIVCLLLFISIIFHVQKNNMNVNECDCQTFNSFLSKGQIWRWAQNWRSDYSIAPFHTDVKRRMHFNLQLSPAQVITLASHYKAPWDTLPLAFSPVLLLRHSQGRASTKMKVINYPTSCLQN